MIRRLLLNTSLSRRFFRSRTAHDPETAIVEFNEEMESIFGCPPVSSDSFPNSESYQTSMPKLTHVGSEGEAKMVDVSSKEITKRTATASCKVLLGEKAFGLVSLNQITKGDVLGVARIAAINGAKQTSSIIPLCHNINLTNVCVDISMNPANFAVEITGEVACNGRTGVEMEALTAVSIAGLTVYDMCKAVWKGIQITDVRLESKSGGKSGYW